MADSLSPNLKLRLNDDLTTDARYNLLKIDGLGNPVKIDNNGDVRFRATGDIFLIPESQDLGGDGSTGQIFLGESGLPVALVSIFAAEVNFNDSLITGFMIDEEITDEMISSSAAINASKIANGTISNTEFQYLNGLTGNIQDQLDNLSGANQLVASWVSGDGTSKTVTHGFNTRNILVQVLDDSNNYQTVEVSVTRPNSNDVVLTSSEAPSSSWTVLLSQVG